MAIRLAIQCVIVNLLFRALFGLTTSVLFAVMSHLILRKRHKPQSQRAVSRPRRRLTGAVFGKSRIILT